MITSTITHIGESALNGKEPMIILFNDTATENLKKISVIQDVKTIESFNLDVNDLIEIDGVRYSIDYVGSLANSNLNDLGHTVLIFSDVPEEDTIKNALYLSPHSMPKLTINSQITFHQKGGNN